MKWILNWRTGVVPAASSGPGLSVSYIWCNSALEELGLRNLRPVVLHFDLLASFTSQVIPPTVVKDKSCLSLHSRKKDYRLLTFCDS